MVLSYLGCVLQFPRHSIIGRKSSTPTINCSTPLWPLKVIRPYINSPVIWFRSRFTPSTALRRMAYRPRTTNSPRHSTPKAFGISPLLVWPKLAPAASVAAATATPMMNTRTPIPQDSCAWQLPAVFLTARVPSIFWHRLILAVLVETCHIQDMARPNRPRDTNQLAKLIVDQATMDEEEPKQSRERCAADQTPGSCGDSSNDTSGNS